MRMFTLNSVDCLVGVRVAWFGGGWWRLRFGGFRSRFGVGDSSGRGLQGGRGPQSTGETGETRTYAAKKYAGPVKKFSR